MPQVVEPAPRAVPLPARLDATEITGAEITLQFSREEIERAEAEWSKRLAACPSVQQPYLIQQYATPVRNQYRLLAGLEP